MPIMPLFAGVSGTLNVTLGGADGWVRQFDTCALGLGRDGQI